MNNAWCELWTAHKKTGLGMYCCSALSGTILCSLSCYSKLLQESASRSYLGVRKTAFFVKCDKNLLYLTPRSQSQYLYKPYVAATGPNGHSPLKLLQSSPILPPDRSVPPTEPPVFTGWDCWHSWVYYFTLPPRDPGRNKSCFSGCGKLLSLLGTIKPRAFQCLLVSTGWEQDVLRLVLKFNFNSTLYNTNSEATTNLKQNCDNF